MIPEFPALLATETSNDTDGNYLYWMLSEIPGYIFPGRKDNGDEIYSLRDNWREKEPALEFQLISPFLGLIWE